MSEPTLALHTRPATGTTSVKAARRAGSIPGTLYGHASTPIAVAFEERAFTDLMRSGAGHHLIAISIDGKGHDTVLVRALQRHPISRAVLHADFQRVSATEAIRASVPITILGIPKGVKDGGGVLDFACHELEISGPANALPSMIEIDVTDIDVRGHISASMVKLPAGFTLVTGPDTTILTVDAGKAAPVAAADAPAAT